VIFLAISRQSASVTSLYREHTEPSHGAGVSCFCVWTKKKNTDPSESVNCLVRRDDSSAVNQGVSMCSNEYVAISCTLFCAFNVVVGA